MTAHDDIYLDYAAATPVDAAVLEAMLPYFTQNFCNPSAPYARGREARNALEDARTRIAHCIGAKPATVTFTAGATEANNLAFAATDGHVVSCSIEHDSTLACARARHATLIDVDGQGLVSPESVRHALTPETTFASFALANGEVGSIQPIRAIAAVVRDERERRRASHSRTPLLLHTDATQAAGALALNVASLGVDLMTLSAAKIHGPKQVGLLWAREGVQLRPLVLGGGQESGLRSGTENVAGAVGFAAALELACAWREHEARRLAALRDELQARLLEAFPWAVVSGPRKRQLRLPGLLSISFPGLEARRLVILLERRGVSVGTGAACAASKMRSSHVLEALHAEPDVIAASVRITLGRPTTEEHVQRAAHILIDVVRGECARLGLHGKVRP